MDEQDILRFIFNKICKDVIVELDCDNEVIPFEELHKGGLMTEQERQYVKSCETQSDKNR